ncbi:MAG: response regulator transcription factor [Spirochaetes bacterium]|nr:response regulator transcription factor [Spirochaetota bacterium]
MKDFHNIKIAIVDDHPVVRRGITSFLGDESYIEIIGEAATAEEAIELIRNKNPDVSIIDICLGDPVNGLQLLRSLNLKFSGIKVLVLSIFEDSVYAERVRELGGRGYLQKNRGPHLIVEGIKRIYEGKTFFPDDYKYLLVESVEQTSHNEFEKHIAKALTTRELIIFQLFGEGYETNDIAKRLNLSKHTVDSHRKNIKSKLGITRNNELVRMAAQWNISNMKKPI